MLIDRLKSPYDRLYLDLTSFLPPSRLFNTPLQRLAYGTDASFYRLIPQIVIKAETQAEVSKVLRLCAVYGVPVTFRAAGTSLSGQAVSDSVLLTLSGNAWKRIEVGEDGLSVTLDPGVTGAAANRALRPFHRKIGPDPASIDSAMIGGIAANNASGMCCGYHQNSYHTLIGMKVILADGTLVDTQDELSLNHFKQTHGQLLETLGNLAVEVKSDSQLTGLIHRKYRIKNTMGYSLNALVDYTDPIDVLAHLMIGSEGTLGFISEITFRTILEPSFRAAALVSFPSLENACKAVEALALIPQIRAAELMDEASLKAVKSQGETLGVKSKGAEPCAVLVEVGGMTALEAQEKARAAEQAITPFCESGAVHFFHDRGRIEQLWRVRKGLFPTVGALRKTGTSVIIEDVGFPQNRLAQGARDLRGLLRTHGYGSAILFGHALSGNLHFVFTVDWSKPGETEKYGRFMEALAALVSDEYEGALKSEHGTGRNMAPFVEREWGNAAYTVMKRIKAIFDPAGLLNPGVILNSDPAVHLKNLKLLPPADPLVDACIECGFCEPVCPSRNLTLTPRQRIAVYREIRALERSREDPAYLRELKEGFIYQGEQTCAADGLCSVSCPVGIDTGRLMKHLREKKLNVFTRLAGRWVGTHLSLFLTAARGLLTLSHSGRKYLDPKIIEGISLFIYRMTGGGVPRWQRCLPGPASEIQKQPCDKQLPRVVYFPSCLSRLLSTDQNRTGLWQSAASLFKKAGYALVLPEEVEGLCCGLAFESKGHDLTGKHKLEELQEKIWEASQKGTDPVLFDTSPCHARFVEAFSSRSWLGGLWEPAGFLVEKLSPQLNFKPLEDCLIMHVPCSAQKQGLREVYQKAAALLSKQPRLIGEGCCGFAGDKGLNFPELTASAVQGLGDLPTHCHQGTSASPTCELGLSSQTQIQFGSILKLADECSDSKY